mgnify:CR=1 FL=1|tara:strand:- start:83792 stop:84091 length:300 start_codon:yes stop_codon:yes gene_type:complete
MQSENRFFDDLGKIINGAAGTIAGMGREFESNAKEKAREWMAGMDFVSREEFEAVKAMAATAREEVEQLKARLAALESGQTPAPARKTAPKTPRTAKKI